MSFAWWEGFLLRREFAACVVYVEIATGEIGLLLKTTIATGENGMLFRQLLLLW